MAEFESASGLPSPMDPKAAPRRSPAETDVLQVTARLLFIGVSLALAFYFASKGVSLVRHYDDVIRTAYEAKGPPKFPEAGDITVFYTAGKVITSDNPSSLYDPDQFIPQVFETQGWQPGDPYAGSGAWSKFYNPPFFALILSPLSLLDVHTAYVVVLSINVGAGVLLLYLLGRIMRWRQPATILLGLGLFAFTPLYFVFQHAQPSLLLGVILASSFLFMERGAYKPSAVLLVFAGLKPQWLALPILVVAQRRRAALFWLAGAVVLVIIVPFVLVGEQGLRDYIKITLDRGGGDVTDIAFSSASLSWSGFLRALTGSPQPLLWGLLGLITLGTFILICLSGDSRTSAAAAILTTLLVVPHSHPQDWVVIAVAGAIALSRDGPAISNMVTGLALMGIFVAANDWPNESYQVSIGQHAVYWITPAGAALLFWISVQPLVESRIASAPWPSAWRFEWDAPALAGVRPWHLTGAAFSVGMVLGVGAALALVKEPGGNSQFALPLIPAAAGAASQPDPLSPQPTFVFKDAANAAAAWSISAQDARLEPDPFLGAGNFQASALAEGFIPRPAPAAPAAAAGGQAGAPVTAVQGSVNEVSSITSAELGPQAAPAGSQAVQGGLTAAERPAAAAAIAAAAAGEEPRAFLPPFTTIDSGADALAHATDASPAAEMALARVGRAVAVSAIPVRFSGLVAGGSLDGLNQTVGLALPSAIAGRYTLTVSLQVQSAEADAAGRAASLTGGSGTAAGAVGGRLSMITGSVRAAESRTVIARVQGTRTSLRAVGNLGRATGLAAARFQGAAAESARVQSRSLGRADVTAGAESSGLPVRALNPPQIAATGLAAAVIEGEAAANVVRFADASPALALAARSGGRALAGTTRALAPGAHTASTATQGLGGAVGALPRPESDAAATSTQPGSLQALSGGVASGIRALSLTTGIELASWRFNGAAATTRIGTISAALAGAYGRQASIPSAGFAASSIKGMSSLGALKDAVASIRSATAARGAAASAPPPAPTLAPPADRKDCDEIRATGPRTPGEEAFLRSCPAPVVAASPVPPPTATPRPAAPPAPTTAPAPPPSAKCTRIGVTGRPTIVALGEGGFRLDAELAPTEPAGCNEWPAAFSASATLSITSGSAALQGTWACDSGRNTTAGVPASTHFVFFCTISQRTGPPAGTSFLSIQVTALSEQGAVLGRSDQTFPAPPVQ